MKDFFLGAIISVMSMFLINAYGMPIKAIHNPIKPKAKIVTITHETETIRTIKCGGVK